MASGMVEATRNAQLNALLSTANDGTWPAAVFVSLSIADPGADGSGFSEPGVGAYARVEVANTDAGWDAAALGEKVNAAVISFAAASGAAWGTITHKGLHDALSGGNLLYWSPVDNPVTVNVGDDVRFLAGEYKVTYANVA